jgi:hypothetical protein
MAGSDESPRVVTFTGLVLVACEGWFAMACRDGRRFRKGLRSIPQGWTAAKAARLTALVREDSTWSAWLVQVEEAPGRGALQKEQESVGMRVCSGDAAAWTSRWRHPDKPRERSF